MRIVANPGSTIGEALGALIEREVNRLLKPIAEENGCVYVTVGRPNPRTGRPTKLLLKDTAGNEYNIDSVIANDRMQPLVLIESKYIRYKKHNRDKGSWICAAHYSLRRTFPTVRKSIAVIAGSWSGSSKALMHSFDVSLFEVGFPNIVQTLAQYGADFAWAEKDRDRAMAAWQRWEQLSDAEYDAIGQQLLAEVEPELRKSLAETLSSATPREISQVEVFLETTERCMEKATFFADFEIEKAFTSFPDYATLSNLGESRRYVFDSVADAITFLEAFDETVLSDDTEGPTLWDIASS